MNIQDLKEETDRHILKIDDLIKQLRAHILSLPDNPRINRFKDNPNGFTMSSKDLNNDWSVVHHDFKKQYQEIMDQLKASESTNILHKLHTLINEEKILKPGSYSSIKLHPDVVNHLRRLANMPPTKCPYCCSERDWCNNKEVKAFCFCCGKITN
jgi:hypothetical protein